MMLSVSALQFYISTVSIQQSAVPGKYSLPLVETADRTLEPRHAMPTKDDDDDSADPEEEEDEVRVAARKMESEQEDDETNETDIVESPTLHLGAPPVAAAPKPRVIRWLQRPHDDDRFSFFVLTSSSFSSIAVPPPFDSANGIAATENDDFQNHHPAAEYHAEDQPNPIKEAMVQKFLDECVPMASWQTQSFPTCNTLHEMDIVFQNDFAISLLSDQGSWRSVWKVQRDLSHSAETLVLKLLKFQRRDFNAESYEHHRVDALAMERLTASRHIVNVYGYCGQSVVTEYAATTARLLTKNTTLTSMDRLKMGRDIVRAMMDLHSMDYPNATNITFTHNDLNMANAVAVQGHIKLNDFNIGVLQRWNRTTQAICKTPVLFEAPLWKSPEEIVAAERLSGNALDEDTTRRPYHPALNTEHWVFSGPTDVFGLGNLLFQVLTKRQPWTHLEPDGAKNASDAGRRKVRGEQPFVPPKYHAHNTSHVALAALHYAVQLCYRTDPAARPTSYQLWRQLNTAIAWIEERGGKIYPRELEALFLGALEKNVPEEE
jgi:Protein kinase domain